MGEKKKKHNKIIIIIIYDDEYEKCTIFLSLLLLSYSRTAIKFYLFTILANNGENTVRKYITHMSAG